MAPYPHHGNTPPRLAPVREDGGKVGPQDSAAGLCRPDRRWAAVVLARVR